MRGIPDASPLALAFLAAVATATATAPLPAEADAGPAAPRAVSAATGRDLFLGARPFQNGGAPCGACHAVGGEGLAFAGSLGPELSTGLASMDDASLDGLLETLPFPTMAPIYEGHPLTPAERADLAAFLRATAGAGAPREGNAFVPWGVAAGALLFLALGLGGRGRGSARARLLARPPSQGGSR